MSAQSKQAKILRMRIHLEEKNKISRLVLIISQTYNYTGHRTKCFCATYCWLYNSLWTLSMQNTSQFSVLCVNAKVTQLQHPFYFEMPVLYLLAEKTPKATEQPM